MTSKNKILILRSRQRLLSARGPHNSHIVAKLERKICALQKQSDFLFDLFIILLYTISMERDGNNGQEKYS